MRLDSLFKTIRLDAWEAQHWHAAQRILSTMNLTLDNWLGASSAKAPQKLLEHAARARIDAIKVRVQQSRD